MATEDITNGPTTTVNISSGPSDAGGAPAEYYGSLFNRLDRQSQEDIVIFIYRGSFILGALLTVAVFAYEAYAQAYSIPFHMTDLMTTVVFMLLGLPGMGAFWHTVKGGHK